MEARIICFKWCTPPKTHMTLVKTSHEWRCISYYHVVIFQCHVSLQGCFFEKKSVAATSLAPKQVFGGDRKNCEHCSLVESTAVGWFWIILAGPPVSGTGGKWRFIGFYRDPLLQIIIILMVTGGTTQMKFLRWRRWKFFQKFAATNKQTISLLNAA